MSYLTSCVIVEVAFAAGFWGSKGKVTDHTTSPKIVKAKRISGNWEL